MPVFRRKSLPAVVFAAALAAWVLRGLWAPAIAEFLIRTDPLERADAVVALAGDASGERAVEAARLVADGYGAFALLDGAGSYYGRPECLEAVRFAGERGYSGAALEAFCIGAESTLEEAQLVDAELRRRGVRTALVVTSDYHTRRARMIFRGATGGQVEYRFTAVPMRGFSPSDWWRRREARALVAQEYLKNLNSWFENLL